MQWILGHAHLSTTQISDISTAGEIVESVLAHHRRQAGRSRQPGSPHPGTGRKPWASCSDGTRGEAALTASPGAGRAARISPEALVLQAEFPSRKVPASWEAHPPGPRLGTGPAARPAVPAGHRYRPASAPGFTNPRRPQTEARRIGAYLAFEVFPG